MTDRVARDFLNCFAAVPLYCVGHARLQRVQLVSRAPADVVVFFGGARDVGGVFWACPVNHSDVLVCVGDAVNIQKPRGDQCACAGAGGWWTFAKQRDVHTALFPGFAQCRLFRVLIQFDVAAQRQPCIQFAMVDQQDLRVVDDEDGDREINFLVNVRHVNV